MSRTQISQPCFHPSINSCLPWTPSVCIWINCACHDHAWAAYPLKGDSWSENVRISAANTNLATSRPSFGCLPCWYSCVRPLSKSHWWNDPKLSLKKYWFCFIWLISMMWFLIWGHPCHPVSFHVRGKYMNDDGVTRSFTRFPTEGHKNYKFAIHSSKEYSIS